MGFFDSVVKAVTSIPGKLVGSVLDIGSSLLGNELIGKPNAAEAYAQSENAAARAFDRSYGVYKTRYQDTMNDMKLAGLNPILAAGSGGFNVSGTPQMSTAQSFMPNYPQMLTSSAYQAMKSGELDEERRNTETKKQDKLAAEAKVALQRVMTERSKRGLMSQQEAELAQRIQESIARQGRIFHEVTKMGFESDKLQIEKKKMEKELKIIEENYKMLVKMSGWYKGAYGEFLGWMRATLSAIGSVLGGVGAAAILKK